MSVAALQHKYFEDVHATAILIPPEALFRRASRAADAMGWNIVADAPDEGRIEATDTSLFFGFTDDIVIRVKPSGMGARLDIRSEARQGDKDWGRNADRIRAYMKKLAKSNCRSRRERMISTVRDRGHQIRSLWHCATNIVAHDRGAESGAIPQSVLLVHWQHLMSSVDIGEYRLGKFRDRVCLVVS